MIPQPIKPKTHFLSSVLLVILLFGLAWQSKAQDSNNQLQGSVPQGTATATPVPLSLYEAINRGLHANLSLLTSEQSSDQSRAERVKALSALLPNVTGQAGETVQQINLQTVGFLFSFPGISIPKIVGPYSYQEARATATLPIFNYSNISRLRAAREQVKSAVLEEKNARDLVVQAVANAYLQIISDASRVVATQAEVDADSAVFTNADRRHEAGTAVGIDVLRSQVELKRRQQTLVAQRNQFEIDKLTLGRVIGLPPGQDFTVTDPNPSVKFNAMTLKDALAQAYDKRPDYRAAQARLVAARMLVRASKAERYPTLQAQGYYGDEGLREFTDSHGVFSMAATVNFNIFDGGRIHADVAESNIDLHNRQNELDNLRGQIDLEVRSALLNLQSASDQLDVAQSNTELANLAQKQSQDRFIAGVTNTVEVVQAQQQVAEANESLIAAQFQYNVAKVALARSLGIAEDGVKTYFKQ